MPVRLARGIPPLPPGHLFENLGGSGFRVELPVDEDGIVLDYPNRFRRVPGK